MDYKSGYRHEPTNQLKQMLLLFFMFPLSLSLSPSLSLAFPLSPFRSFFDVLWMICFSHCFSEEKHRLFVCFWVALMESFSGKSLLARAISQYQRGAIRIVNAEKSSNWLGWIIALAWPERLQTQNLGRTADAKKESMFSETDCKCMATNCYFVY